MSIVITRKLHRMMLYRTFHSKLGDFIERVASSTVLNRFASDLNDLDGQCASIFSDFVDQVCGLVASMFFMGLTVSWY